MRSNKSTPPQQSSFNEEKIAKLMRCAKYGLLKPTSPYLDDAIKTGKYTIEEVNEAKRRYELTLNDTPNFFSTVNVPNIFYSIFSNPNTKPAGIITKAQSILNVKSIDFDGCIFNRNYIRLKTASRLIDANARFIKEVSNTIVLEKYDGVVFMIGSNRQSLAIDNVNNRDGRDSCFPALYELCNEFQKHVGLTPCQVNPYLLADTYGKTVSGENFKKALEHDHYYNYSDWLFDDSKLTLVYAQIHQVASRNPQAKIVYDFYDDRYDILNPLRVFFSDNPDLIPNNVIMRLHHYAGNGIKNIAVIQGNEFGEIDFHYHEHINLMIHSAELSFHRDSGKSNNVLSGLTGENLIKFKRQRLVKMQETENTETYYSQPAPLENCSLM